MLPRDEGSERVGDEGWDVIVIGTGPAGATLGHALAKAGKKVLFLEKGVVRSPHDGVARSGQYAELFFTPTTRSGEGRRRILREAGRFGDRIEDRSTRRGHSFFPFIGEGTGGSSALYGMAMERLFPEDFVPARHHAEVQGAALPARWPITYEEMRPYYRRAERLYGVRGEVDPLRGTALLDPLAPAPPLSRANAELARHLQSKGGHPYRLPMACAFVEGCRECQGFLCDKECKQDSRSVCIEPAMREHGAHLWEDCVVESLEMKGRRVAGVRCIRKGVRHVVRGELVVLAAGALSTPAILLRSRTHRGDEGVANESGLVGKCLMRHCIDMYAIRTAAPMDVAGSGLTKEIALNDLYLDSGVKLGSVQSFGRMPPGAVVVEEMRDAVVRSRLPSAATLLSLASPIVRRVVDGFLGRRLVLASILEDLPYEDNRVSISPRDPWRITIHYRCHPYEQRRITVFRKRMRQLIAPLPLQMIKQAENNERIAHACGTCRFGDDPASSVLDRDNRAHGVENLYVVDSSFFPSSGGVNPALTLIANALRVADSILGGRAVA